MLVLEATDLDLQPAEGPLFSEATPQVPDQLVEEIDALLAVPQ